MDYISLMTFLGRTGGVIYLQNYMFERLLERLSVSEYSEKFVVKGGMLITAIVGLDTRSTMDLDTALRNLPLTEEKISAALNSICKINLNDDVSTGDIITPSAVKYEFGGIFDEKQQNN